MILKKSIFISYNLILFMFLQLSLQSVKTFKRATLYIKRNIYTCIETFQFKMEERTV